MRPLRLRPSSEGRVSSGGDGGLWAIGWEGAPGLRFASDAVSDEDLRAILGVATQAPSGGNLQPWRFVAVRNEIRREHVARACGLEAAGAPVFVVACTQPGPWEVIVGQLQGCPGPAGEADVAGWLNRHVSVALTYMMVTAKALGWDAVPCERLELAALRRALSIPPEAGIVAVLAIGRLAARPALWRERLALDDLVATDQWALQWTAPAAAAV